MLIREENVLPVPQCPASAGDQTDDQADAQPFFVFFHRIASCLPGIVIVAVVPLPSALP